MRLAGGVGVLLVSSFLMYLMVWASGDPLADLRADLTPDRDRLIAERSARLDLGRPVVLRYLGWLRGVLGCLPGPGPCDLGRTLDDNAVGPRLAAAVAVSARLVVLAVVVAAVLGVAAGVLAATRRGSALDRVLGSLAALLFVLPVFWVALLLKQFAAIDVNDWLADPVLSGEQSAALTGVAAAAAALLAPPRARPRVLAAAGAAVVAALALFQVHRTDWFRDPALGPVAVAAGTAAAGLAVAVLARPRRGPAVAALALAGVGLVATPWVTDPLLTAAPDAGPGLAVAAGLVLIAAAAVGAASLRSAPRVGALVGLVTGGAWVLLTGVDVLLRTLPAYSLATGGRPLPTSGAQTPGISGPLSLHLFDLLVHLVLPATALGVVSFAVYLRYTRAAVVEELGQDYVRTARAKGLPEPAVLVTHVLRRALVPVTTVVTLDVGAVVGGTALTETVFGLNGLGPLATRALVDTDPNLVMACYLVVAIAVLVLTAFSDAVQHVLDPRPESR